jgi:hypothetical protein
MPYKVQLIYFRQTGKFLAVAQTVIAHEALVEIWEEIDDMRRLGQLPSIRLGAGRDLVILVDVPDHPDRVLHMVMPPFIDEDDVTPPRVSTREMLPLVRLPLAEFPRTSMRDVHPGTNASDDDDEITPVNQHIPAPPPKSEN